MFGQKFYHRIIRKYVTAFGTLFNDIEVDRFDAAGAVIQTLRVPISYGPKEEWIQRIAQDPELNREVSITLPRLGFEITAYQYDATRKLPATQKCVKVISDGDSISTVFMPVPWNFIFSLYVMVAHADDGTQIIEQILPFFKPEWTASIVLVPEAGITMDTPFVLQDITHEDSYENDFLTRRAQIYTLSFEVKGFLYGPVTDSSVIKRVITEIHINSANGAGESVTVRPGLLANGSPTSNAAASVPLSDIGANSDYGYITTIAGFDE